MNFQLYLIAASNKNVSDNCTGCKVGSKAFILATVGAFDGNVETGLNHNKCK